MAIEFYHGILDIQSLYYLISQEERVQNLGSSEIERGGGFFLKSSKA